MKSRVKLSIYSFLLTLIINVVLIVCCVVTFQEKPGFWIIFSIWAILLIISLFYGPVEIIADHEYLTVRTILLKKRLPLESMKSIELFQPTMASYRLFASGGYFGYWGLFREGDIGRYMAFYGKASDCFLIRMKNGDKYVLGCVNPEKMVNYIKNQKEFVGNKPMGS